jgi:hypothetical protein
MNDYSDRQAFCVTFEAKDRHRDGHRWCLEASLFVAHKYQLRAARTTSSGRARVHEVKVQYRSMIQKMRDSASDFR